ncbi:MAG: hypothetical protein IPQ24_20635 [Anaeromyxobacter sp.]|nr:hypothetical protein [Anaeromyxobacter sp.]
MGSPACSVCGSTRIRRARMREGWQQLLKKHTPLRRYACGECQHRGWTYGRLPHSEHPEEQEARRQELPVAEGRRLERRDHRSRRDRRFRVSGAVVLAVVLGSVIAGLIGLLGRKW